MIYNQLSEIRKLGKEIRKKYGTTPCSDADKPEARYTCPNSGIGGCGGQWGNCSYDFVNDSKEYRKMLDTIKKWSVGEKL